METTRQTSLVADVAIDSRTAGNQAVFTYLAPAGARLGEAWTVPLGTRRTLGYIIRTWTAAPEDLPFPVQHLKPLGERVRGIEIPERVINLLEYTASESLSTLASCIGLATPPGVRERLETVWKPTGAHALTPPSGVQAEALAVLEESGSVGDRSAGGIDPAIKRALRALVVKGLAVSELNVRPIAERRTNEGLVALNPDAERVESFLSSYGRKRPAQAVALIRLQDAGSQGISTMDLKALAGVTDHTVTELLKAGLLVAVTPADRAVSPRHSLNDDQAAAVATISESIGARRPDEHLLFGVTGSGKTEVYIRCATEALRHGRQVLYLVPEIALTAQVVTQLRDCFGAQVALLHSNMSPRERLENWLAVGRGECVVVLGARSALFAPLNDIGLIIMDEEHESSYKQESSPRYVTRRLAKRLAESHGAPLVCGSATPSIESFHAAEQGDSTLLRLPRRTAEARLPEVETVDLSELFREHKPALISPRLGDALDACLERGEQAILFLNRRAYAPTLQCRECGHRWLCPRCDVSLAHHQRDHALRCHHCGYHEPVVEVCSACGGTKVGPLGIGVERVEEAVRDMFPAARVARLDRDVSRRQGALEETVAAFRAGDTNVLVGTQMVAKGFDFPRVTLVGVIAADVSLNIPDFRASERTFQLLSQVAGRAGRAERPGRVLIQTFLPGHPAIVAASAHDYEGFYRSILEERRAAGYPPFVRLVNVIITGADRGMVVSKSSAVAKAVSSTVPEAVILGPTDCPLARLDGLWRRHVLIKLSPGADPSPLGIALAGLDGPNLRIVADVDPASLS